MATGPFFFGIPILEMGGPPGQYFLLQDHYIANNLILAGTTVLMGGNWVPTPNVDPLDINAVTAFYNAGPRDLGLSRQQWTNIPMHKPITYWVPFIPAKGGATGKLITFGLPILEIGGSPKPNLWVLTGLGSDHGKFPPKYANLRHPVQGYPN